MHAFGAELAFEKFAVGVYAAQRGFDLPGRDAEACGGVGRGERAVRARVTAQQFEQWTVDRLKERSRDAWRQRHANRVAIARGVFHGDEARFARDADADGTSRGGELLDVAASGTRLDFGDREIAEAKEKVVDRVGVARLVVGVERLQLLLDFGERVFVEEFAEIGAAENFFELRLVD